MRTTSVIALFALAGALAAADAGALGDPAEDDAPGDEQPPRIAIVPTMAIAMRSFMSGLLHAAASTGRQSHVILRR